MKFATGLLIAVTAIISMGTTVARAEGTWRFLDHENEHVQYRDGKQLIFMLGCAKETGFEVNYPDQSKKEGQSKVDVSNGNMTLHFDGELYVPGDGPQKGIVKLYVQLDDEGDLLQLLSAKLPIEVTTDAGKIALPAPAFENLKTRWDKACN